MLTVTTNVLGSLKLIDSRSTAMSTPISTLSVDGLYTPYEDGRVKHYDDRHRH